MSQKNYYSLGDLEEASSGAGLIPEHYNFYARGIFNSILPSFLGGGKFKITEEDVNGETLEALKVISQKLHPNLKDGESVLVRYEDVAKVFNSQMGVGGTEQDRLSNLEGRSFDDVSAQLRLALGNFTLTKENGQYVIHDIYDFARSGEVDTFGQAAFKQAQTYSPYFYARYFGEKLMSEDKKDNIRVRIAIPNEPKIAPNAFEPEFDVASGTFNLEGPMTPRRKSLWDTISASLFQTAEAQEAEFSRQAAETGSTPLPPQKPETTPISVQVPPKRRTIDEIQAERTAQNEAEFMGAQSA